MKAHKFFSQFNITFREIRNICSFDKEHKMGKYILKPINKEFLTHKQFMKWLNNEEVEVNEIN